MRVYLQAPWRETEEEARADRHYLVEKFNLEHSHGLETINLTDHKEYRANCYIEV